MDEKNLVFLKEYLNREHYRPNILLATWEVILLCQFLILDIFSLFLLITIINGSFTAETFATMVLLGIFFWELFILRYV